MVSNIAGLVVQLPLFRDTVLKLGIAVLMVGLVRLALDGLTKEGWLRNKRKWKNEEFVGNRKRYGMKDEPRYKEEHDLESDDVPF